VLKKIPQKVIQNAVGLAIFTTMRTGLWISGAGGSGVLIARKEDGTWSPPSGILLHTAGLGFLVGVDIYDCVLVINNRKALEAFMKLRATLGGEISAVAGPVGIGGVLEHDGKWKQANKPVFTYLKSRGFYAGVQVDGTIVIERSDENERFYGQKIGVADILAGKARHPPPEIKLLMETVKAAEGSNDVDQELMGWLEDQPAPGDVGIESPTRPTSSGPIFGLPEPDDPDPFGVLALERAGMEIREAGSGIRPSSEQFEYRPSPTSPIFSKFHRLSMDTVTTTSNRESYMSHRTRGSTDRATQTSEMGTQTDPNDLVTPGTSPGLSNEDDKIMEEEEVVHEPEEIDYTKIDLGPYNGLTHSQNGEYQSSGTTVNGYDQEHDHHMAHANGHDMDASYHTEEDVEADDEEDPIVFEVAAVQATSTMVSRPQVSVVKARGSLVDIGKRVVPPPLPPRNPFRANVDQASGRSATPSPIKDGFEDAELGGPTRVASVYEVMSGAAQKEGDAEDENSHFVNGAHHMGTEPPDVDIPEEDEHDLDKEKAAEYKPLDHMNGLSTTTTGVGDEDDFHSIPTTPN
jgi:lipid-binding SYLF domain-containing protein